MADSSLDIPSLRDTVSRSVLASLGYHDFEGPALRDDEKPRLVTDLGAGAR